MRVGNYMCFTGEKRGGERLIRSTKRFPSPGTLT